MNMKLLWIIVCVAALPLIPPAFAEGGQGSKPASVVTQGRPNASHPPFVSSSRRLLTPPELLDAPDEWINRSLQWVDFILRNYPPGLTELPERRPALFRLDEILHIESAPKKPLVQDFYRMRFEHAIEEIEHTKVTEGIRVWKLYNAGFLVRTPTVSFTFDVVPGAQGTPLALPPDLLHRLVAQSDALFISHRHSDHANAQVARMFLADHKPVIVPKDLWNKDPELSKQVIYPERTLEKSYDIPVQGGTHVLKVVTYPGHQEDILDNVNLVTTPEGFTVVQTGDQDSEPGEVDFDWLAKIGHYHHVDILMVDGWAPGLHRIVRGINPELVITAHENEMAHVVPHREEYNQSYERMFGLHYPYLVMTWGESYVYKKPVTEIGVLPNEN